MHRLDRQHRWWRGSTSSISATARRSPRCGTPAGVVMLVIVGPPRASRSPTAGSRRFFPADRFSAVAIAGAAGPAIEMVRLFQTQLEHYEKVEGAVLSLEGKANQALTDGAHPLPLAMRASPWCAVLRMGPRARPRRIFTYDVTGGSTKGDEVLRTGSGGRTREPRSNSDTGRN